MLIIQSGDLLKSDCEFLVHGCNCQGALGSGVAGAIRKKYPKVYETFSNDKRLPLEKLGSYCLHSDDNVVIWNLYTQLDCGYDGKLYTSYDALTSALENMCQLIQRKDLAKHKIGMPYKMCSVLGGASWDLVEEILIKASEKWKLDFYIYKL